MDTYELVVPCHFGLEAVTKREIYDLGYEITRVEDGRVTFAGDAEAICRANIFLRSAERVLLQVGRFRATTFDELFEGIKALPWEDYIPKDGKFWVKKASSIKSKLFSPSDIQSIAKKAMVERLKNVYRLNWFPEDGAPYPVRIFLLKDEVMVTLDTSGDSLHKRGYRLMTSKAPLTETLAAALIMLTPWKKDRILVDPFCGSGTFPIEAAMIAANIAPGMNRQFTAEQWKNLIPKQLWYDTVEEAQEYPFSMCAVPFTKDDREAPAQAEALLAKGVPAAVITNEAPGRNAKGAYHNAVGKCLTELEAKSDVLFNACKARGIYNLSIGDLGNEIGMAAIGDHIRKYVPHADDGECECSCGGGILVESTADNLITATCSDWGCNAMMAATAYLLGNADLFQSEEVQQRAMEEAARAGLLDMYGRNIPSIDGFGRSINLPLVKLMKELISYPPKVVQKTSGWFADTIAKGYFDGYYGE